MSRKRFIISALGSIAVSAVIVATTIFSGPVIKVEYNEGDIETVSRVNSLTEYDEESMIIFLKQHFSKLSENNNELSELKSIGYDIQYVDFDQDNNDEAVLTGGFGVPAVVLKKDGMSFKILYQNDGIYKSSFKKDSYDNLCFNFSYSNLVGTGYYEEVMLRWDGQFLREVWRGITEDYRVTFRSSGEEWYKTSGIYEVYGDNNMELKYVKKETIGVIENSEEKTVNEKTTVKEFTFDDASFKFIEK